MKGLSSKVNRFARSRRGATAIEYTLIAALVGVVLIGALGGLGDVMNHTLGTLETSLR